MKLTKRKGFNFFRSYFDVYNELPEDSRLAFIDALLNKQFMGVNPKKLKGMTKFAYISQLNSIESQVKGYEDKTRTRLDGTPYESKKATPTQGGRQGGSSTPTLQVEEKEKEKEKEEDVLRLYNNFVDEVKEGYHKQATEQMYMRLKIKEGTLTPLLQDFKGQMIIDRKLHPNTLELRKHFNNWLNTLERNGKLDKYKI